jgi:ribose transport system substrate-binding protein
MRTDPIGGIRLMRLAGSLAVAGLIFAACSGGTASTAPSAAAPSAAAPSAAESQAAAPSVNDKTLEIAYLSFAVANSYDAPMLAAAKAAAAAGNANLTVFDANLDPAAQVKQLQDAVASGKYDAILTQPLYGAGMVEDVKKAIAAGIAVGNIDQVLGSDMTPSSRASSVARSASSS